MEPLYTAEALATGAGRNGHVQIAGTELGLDLAIPKEMGGSGNGYNPEQLFAAGYSACFHSALQMVARTRKLELGESSVGARVNISKQGEGFGLSVVLEVVIPAQPEDVARELVEQAHQVCPYSNATRGNIDVDLVVSQD